MPARAFWRTALVLIAAVLLSGLGTAGAGADPLLPVPVPVGPPWCC